MFNINIFYNILLNFAFYQFVSNYKFLFENYKFLFENHKKIYEVPNSYFKVPNPKFQCTFNTIQLHSSYKLSKFLLI